MSKKPMTNTPSTPSQRKPPTAAEVLARQKADAEKRHSGNGTAVATATTSTPVAMPDKKNATAQYLDEIAPASIVGRMIKFSKDGQFVTSDDGESISDVAEFVVLADQTLVGWLKFNEDTPPDRVMGLLYDGFAMTTRNTLGNTDEAEWPTGLSGQPDDPWKHQICLVLQNTETTELFTFVTSSKTGRRSVGNLLRHYDRMLRMNPGELPVVRLKASGFQHRDDRVGWVPTPAFQVVGRAPRDSVAKPDTSPGGDLNDSIPFALAALAAIPALIGLGGYFT
jgi:hypothetical protein